MIDLTHAIRLCNISNDEIVYFRRVELPCDYYCIRVKTVREKLNMKSVQVHRIDIKTDYYGHWKGWCFYVTGISKEKLEHLSWS